MRRVVALAFAVFAASCGGQRRAAGDTPDPAPLAPAPARAAPSAPTSVAAASSDAGAPPSVERAPALTRRLEVRDPGREPRRMLRHTFAAGARQKFRVEIVTRLRENDRDVDKFGLEAPLDVTIGELRDDGSARFRYVLGPIKLNRSGAGRIALGPDAGAGGVRVSGNAIIAPNGEVLDHGFEPPMREDLPEADFVKSLLASVVELPALPVGPGARWDLVLDAQSAEVGITRTTSYELSQLVGASARVKVTHSELVKAPDGGALNAFASPPSAGEWLARLGQVFPEGKQTMKAPIAPGQTRDEVLTELRVKR